MPAIDIDREAAHEAASHELAKPMYPQPSLTDRLSQWIDEFLYRLIMKGSTVPGGWFTIAVLALLVLAALVVAVRIARRTMRTNRRGDQGLFGMHEMSAAEHRATAEGHAAQRNWAAAIRHRLRAVGRQLEETGLLNPVPGRTANELATDAGELLPGFKADLRRAATVFNDVTYGEQPGTEAGYRVVAEIDEALRRHSAPSAETSAEQTVTASWVPLR